MGRSYVEKQAMMSAHGVHLEERLFYGWKRGSVWGEEWVVVHGWKSANNIGREARGGM